MKRFVTALLLSCLMMHCVGTRNGTAAMEALPAAAMQVYGRHLINQQQQVALISSAAHFGFSFDGRECRLFTSIPNADGHNYLQYEMDGVYKSRIRIDGSSNNPVIITATTPGKHTVWIYKATEAHTGPVWIEKVMANNLQPLKRTSERLIEFIGNSITCGAAADTSEVPCGKGSYHDQHNAYMAYGPRVARALEMEYILNSVSGIGIYRNWNSDGPVMPDVYDKLDFQPNSNLLYDFSKVRPEVICIALGTNDFSNGDGRRVRLPFDSARFTEQYTRFVRFIRSKNPQATIALLSSPMVHGERNSILQRALQKVKNRIDQLYPDNRPLQLFFFPPMKAGGCTGHPSVSDHAILAEQLRPFIKTLMDGRK